MPEGPMNIEPKPVEMDVETTNVASDNIAKQQTGLTDLPVEAEAVPAGTTAHFPTHAPRLYAGAQKTLNALKGNR